MTLLTISLFAIASCAIVLTWNRFFSPVPWRVAIVLWLFCAAYQGTTLFTARVDVPGNLAFVAYPWQATGRPAVKANTGILFAQIAPWSRIARDIVRAGEAPLWNRTSASGAPLLANQQTAIYHPFTLLGLLLPLGKAFTLSACLRLFLVAFFTFVLLRNWEIALAGAIFGAVAYTFCSFHVVWLLFPLGLSTMMLPLCLVGVQELVRELRTRSFAVLLLGLSRQWPRPRRAWPRPEMMPSETMHLKPGAKVTPCVLWSPSIPRLPPSQIRPNASCFGSAGLS